MANNLIDMANGEKESSVLTPVLCPYRPSRSLPDPASLTLSPLGLRDTRTHKLPGRLLPRVGGPRNLEGGGSSLFPPPQSNPPPSTPQLAAEIRKTLFRPPSPPANSSSHFFISSSESLHLYSLALSSKSFPSPSPAVYLPAELVALVLFYPGGHYSLVRTLSRHHFSVDM